jgi:hypothetical protein
MGPCLFIKNGVRKCSIRRCWLRLRGPRKGYKEQFLTIWWKTQTLDFPAPASGKGALLGTAGNIGPCNLPHSMPCKRKYRPSRSWIA